MKKYTSVDKELLLKLIAEFTGLAISELNTIRNEQPINLVKLSVAMQKVSAWIKINKIVRKLVNYDNK